MFGHHHGHPVPAEVEVFVASVNKQHLKGLSHRSGLPMTSLSVSAIPRQTVFPDHHKLKFIIVHKYYTTVQVGISVLHQISWRLDHNSSALLYTVKC